MAAAIPRHDTTSHDTFLRLSDGICPCRTLPLRRPRRRPRADRWRTTGPFPIYGAGLRVLCTNSSPRTRPSPPAPHRWRGATASGRTPATGTGGSPHPGWRPTSRPPPTRPTRHRRTKTSSVPRPRPPPHRRRPRRRSVARLAENRRCRAPGPGATGSKLETLFEPGDGWRSATLSSGTTGDAAVAPPATAPTTDVTPTPTPPASAGRRRAAAAAWRT